MSIDAFEDWLVISIHAPREGGDDGFPRMQVIDGDFNPRPPRGGRPCLCCAILLHFQISIHAPREGGDLHF